MPCFCRVFHDFFQSMPCFFHFFAVIFYCPYVSEMGHRLNFGKSSESVQCAITGPCLRMRHRPSALRAVPIRKICLNLYLTPTFCLPVS